MLPIYIYNIHDVAHVSSGQYITDACIASRSRSTSFPLRHFTVKAKQEAVNSIEYLVQVSAPHLVLEGILVYWGSRAPLGNTRLATEKGRDWQSKETQ